MTIVEWLPLCACTAVFWIFWGWRRVKRRIADAAMLSSAVTADEIPALTKECIDAFRTKLDVELSVADLDGAVDRLDKALTKRQFVSVERAFEKPDHPGWAVLPLGAFLGSLVEHHLGGRWVAAKGGGLGMEVVVGNATLTIHPFDKIRKQRFSKAPGDLVAYLVALKTASDSLT